MHLKHCSLFCFSSRAKKSKRTSLISLTARQMAATVWRQVCHLSHTNFSLGLGLMGAMWNFENRFKSNVILFQAEILHGTVNLPSVTLLKSSPHLEPEPQTCKIISKGWLFVVNV